MAIQEQMESCARKYGCNIHAIYIFNYVELNTIKILKNQLFCLQAMVQETAPIKSVVFPQKESFSTKGMKHT